MHYAVDMSTPVNAVTTDEILAALLARAGGVVSVTEEEILNIRRNPSSLVVDRDPDHACYVGRLDSGVPTQVSQQDPNNQDAREIGPGL